MSTERQHAIFLSRPGEIYEQKVAPDGRAECPDCELLERVLGLAKNNGLKQRDALRFMTPQEQTRFPAQAQYQQWTASFNTARTTNAALPDKGTSLFFNWDWRE